jgi:transcriptional regulator with XRE-family HTH domain
MEEFGLQDIGKRIQAARKAKKKTQDEVAAAVGLTKKTISEWERGLKQPGLLNILAFCKFLGITVDELLELQSIRTLHLELSEQERDALLAMVHDCEQDTEFSHLQPKLQTLAQQLKGLFNRAHIK